MKKIVVGLLLIGLCINLIIIFSNKPRTNNQNIGRSFTTNELQKYNGDDPSLPIYLAYNGNVYDVTAGKTFYDTKGVYHYLAGRDSTKELNFAGGGIIKAKYKIIGYLLK